MLNCLNCKKPVAPAEAKTYAGVFVCPDCFATAERLEQRGSEQLKWLLTVQREAIRLALIDGRLHLGPTDLAEGPSKREVLEQVLNLAEKVHASSSPGTRPGHPPGRLRP